MSTATAHGMSIEEFLQLPDDGVERELIQGRVEESGVTVRNRQHSRCLIEVGSVLNTWARRSNDATVVGGEVGFVLSRDPNTVVGIDVAVVARDLLRSQDDDSTLIHGAPVVAVEILSPSDTQAQIRAKTKRYLDHGVAAVWLVDPDEKTVRIHRAHRPPELLNESQRIQGQPELPGFSVDIQQVFAQE